MSYTISNYIKKDGSYLNFGLDESVSMNEALGDQIGVCGDDDILWVDELIDLEDDEVQEFLENYFKRPISVALLISKMKG